MKTPKHEDPDHIPEHDDPAYDNPIGKLPDKQAVPERTKQPFDFLATGLHTEAERTEFADAVENENLGRLLEEQALRAGLWTKKLAKREAFAHATWQAAKAGSPEEAKWERILAMESRARDVWNTEIAMAVKELRNELRELLEGEYPDLSRELRHNLAWDEM